MFSVDEIAEIEQRIQGSFPTGYRLLPCESTTNPEPAGEPGERPLPESYSTPWTSKQAEALHTSTGYEFEDTKSGGKLELKMVTYY